MSAEGQYLVGQLGFQVLRAQYPEVRWVGGLTLGADPIAYAVAHRSWLEEDPIDAFTVRKQAKSYGTGRRIEGGLPTGVSVVAVEDTLTSGSSALDAVAALEEHGVEVRAVFTLIDRGAGGAEAVRDAGYPLLTLFTAAELLEVSRHAEAG
jgi:orotate phosphoribosyltransferase